MAYNFLYGSAILVKQHAPLKQAVNDGIHCKRMGSIFMWLGERLGGYRALCAWTSNSDALY